MTKKVDVFGAMLMATLVSGAAIGTCDAVAGTAAQPGSELASPQAQNPPVNYADPFLTKEMREAAERDFLRTMKMMHIDSMRPAVSPDPKSPHVANFDEEKAALSSNLPDPLVLNSGAKVTTADMWWKQRRPEIMEAFDREIFGRVPVDVPSVHWVVVSTTKDVNNGVPVIIKKLSGQIDNSAYPAIKTSIEAVLVTPAKARGPVPVIMHLDWSPHEGGADAIINFKKLAEHAPEDAQTATWQQQVLAKGWGYAVYFPMKLQADNAAGLTSGIIGLVNKGHPRSKPDEWGALRAWAWGASRVLDYFETDKSVDAKQTGIVGLSRLGKTTLLAMAYDQRFAIAYVASSGEGGAKVYRRNFGEPVENLASVEEYYWMAPNFLKYAGPLTADDLPIDANELIALCAPRPVFIGVGATWGKGEWKPMGSDGWVDAKGQFLAAVDASRVYEFLGKRGLKTAEFPPIGTTLIEGDLAYRQHTGGHVTEPNWPTFVEFAQRYLRVGSAAK